MEGLKFLQNIKPSLADDFIEIRRFVYVCPFGNKIRVLIDAEIHENNICVLSFFHKKDIDSDDKYKTRVSIGAGQTRSLLKACIYVYLHKLKEDYALVFSAANDIGVFKEYNSRYSCYIKILTRELDYNVYDEIGSIGLNLKMYLHRSFQYKKEAMNFYDKFESKCKIDLDKQKKEYKESLLKNKNHSSRL